MSFCVVSHKITTMKTNVLSFDRTINESHFTLPQSATVRDFQVIKVIAGNAAQNIRLWEGKIII